MIKKKNPLILLFLTSLTLLFTSANASESQDKFQSCVDHPELQIIRSSELQSIVEADQKDRVPPIDWSVVSPRDQERAIRVSEIFAQGCIQTSDDYAAAALIFQHGAVPDHYYQAYLFAKKSFELGRKDQSQMIANAIDRYLISIGQKQLFAAQTFRNAPNGCRCLGEVEQSFPDQMRIEYTGSSLRDRIEFVQKSNETNPLCNNVIYCLTNLQPPVKGTFPGIW